MASLSSASPPSTDALAQKIINLENEIEGYKQELVKLKADLQTAKEAEAPDKEKIDKIEARIENNKDAIKVMHIRLTGLEADQRQAAAHAQPVAGGGGTVQTPFMELWKHIKNGEVSFENKILSLRNNKNNVKWIDEVKEILVRESWEQLRDNILSCKNKYVILRGKSGRGKSVFLVYLIYFILKRAMDGTDSDPKHVASPTIIYVSRSGVAHWISLDQVRELPNNMSFPQVDYYFSDNVDIKMGNMGKFLNLALTSGDMNVLKEFNKRMEEPNAESMVCYMMSLNIEEMKVLFHDMSVEDVQFKFDIVGGNPRKFMSTQQPENDLFYNLVHGAIELMFGQEYLPVGGHDYTDKQRLGEWALHLVQSTLQSAETSNSTDSSLFKDYFITEVGNKPIKENFATTFMGIVGGAIADHLQGNLNESLKRLFGSTGLGNSFEFSCHGLLLNSKSKEHWCFDVNYTAIKLSFGEKNKVLIRNIADIETLKDGDYGLPTVCNFPLVDAVIKPDIVLQMTISNRHEGAINRADEIASIMGIRLDKMKMVFVVPLDQIKSFSFPPALLEKNVPMYLSAGENVTQDVLLQHIPTKRHSRKASSASKPASSKASKSASSKNPKTS